MLFSDRNPPHKIIPRKKAKKSLNYFHDARPFNAVFLQAMRLERVGKGGIDYLFLTGSINIASISKSIFKRLIASLASLILLKGPAITR
jgi:hypothetical protein